MDRNVYTRSHELFDRAARVIPGGIYGSKSPGFVVPGDFPYFFTRGKGARLWDADGNEFIDFMCGYGSQIIGYGNEEVDAAAVEQIRGGDLMTSPAPVMVELAERITGTIQGADWAVFAKNGTDVTTLALSLARVHTGRKKFIVARKAYHGSANWCSSNDYPELDDKRDILYFEYNDVTALEALFDQYRGKIAGIMLTPFHHPAFSDCEMPTPDFFPAVQRLCREEGALFVMDDIRANFRLSLQGSHVFFNADPDLVCMGKSIANGYPLAILTGREALRTTTDAFFITGTFWTAAASMAASMKTLDIMERDDVLARMNRLGTRLKTGLIETGREFGYDITVSGPPAIPFMRFTGDPDLFHNQVFCGEMTARGVYLHPHHNWFISAAMEESDIDETIEKSRTAFRITREKLDQEG